MALNADQIEARLQFLDCINLRGIKAYGTHGLLPEEKVTPQLFVVDADLYVDLAPAALTDRLSETVDYSFAAQVIVQEIQGQHRDLIETLIARIAQRLLDIPLVNVVHVTLHKPDAPLGVEKQDVALNIWRGLENLGSADELLPETQAISTLDLTDLDLYAPGGAAESFGGAGLAAVGEDAGMVARGETGGNLGPGSKLDLAGSPAAGGDLEVSGRGAADNSSEANNASAVASSGGTGSEKDSDPDPLPAGLTGELAGDQVSDRSGSQKQPTGIPGEAPAGDGSILDCVPVSPRQAIIALGGNLEDVVGTFRQALKALLGVEGVGIVEVSPLIRSQAVLHLDQAPQPDYLNAVVQVKTVLSPRQLLHQMQQIEDALGRTRDERWGARTLDLDLITYQGVQVSEPDLTLPHPRAHQRAFVLLPWSLIEPAAVLPGHGEVVVLADYAPDREGIKEVFLDWQTSKDFSGAPGTGMIPLPRWSAPAAKTTPRVLDEGEGTLPLEAAVNPGPGEDSGSESPADRDVDSAASLTQSDKASSSPLASDFRPDVSGDECSQIPALTDPNAVSAGENYQVGDANAGQTETGNLEESAPTTSVPESAPSPEVTVSTVSPAIQDKETASGEPGKLEESSLKAETKAADLPSATVNADNAPSKAEKMVGGTDGPAAEKVPETSWWQRFKQFFTGSGQVCDRPADSQSELQTVSFLPDNDGSEKEPPSFQVDPANAWQPVKPGLQTADPILESALDSDPAPGLEPETESASDQGESGKVWPSEADADSLPDSAAPALSPLDQHEQGEPAIKRGKHAGQLVTGEISLLNADSSNLKTIEATSQQLSRASRQAAKRIKASERRATIRPTTTGTIPVIRQQDQQ